MNKYDSLKAKKSAVRRQHREEKKMSGTPKKYGYRQLSVPGEVLDELKVVKEKYELAWGGKMSYGDVISRLIAAGKRYDPEVFQIQLSVEAEVEDPVEKALKIFESEDNEIQFNFPALRKGRK